MLRTYFFQKQAAKRIRNLHQHDDSQCIISDQNGHISKYLWFDFEFWADPQIINRPN